ncbi:MAG: hypothetical protein NWE98_04330 [Candidatus Bathyarchaeota archaeon]|nr:hypothetical protein [Candidatus Bathyarchaeota archaeon]
MRRLTILALILFSIVILLSAAFASADTSNSWIHAYQRTNKDWANSIIQCKDGGYMIAGTTNVSVSPPRTQIWLLKIDAQGNAEWNKTYGSVGSAIRSHIIQTNEGGYAIAGTVSGKAELIKLDSSGNTQWNRTYQDVPYTTYANCLIQTNDGGYALAGSTGQSGLSSSNIIYLLKIDKSGGTVWRRVYLQAGLGAPASLIQTKDGGYALLGTTENMNFLLVKGMQTESLNGAKPTEAKTKTAALHSSKAPTAAMSWQAYCGTVAEMMLA